MPPADVRRREIVVDRNGAPFPVRGVEFGEPGRPVDLLFLHGNGFNGLSYRAAFAPLAGDQHILSLDLRGHGRTPTACAPEGRLDHSDMRDDVIAVIEALGQGPVALGGHSLGGAVALMVAAERPDLVTQLVLTEPAIMKREDFARAQRGDHPSKPTVEMTLRRRSVFASRDEARAKLTGRGAFTGWPDEVLRDFLTDGLRERDDGQVELACTIPWEVSNYQAYGHFDQWADMARVAAPLSTLRAEHGSSCPYVRRADFPGRSPRVIIETAPGTGHFLPMTHPHLLTEFVSRALAQPANA